MALNEVDRPGLLVDLVRIITEINVNVVSGEFDTEGLLARATFHVNYRNKALIKPLQQAKEKEAEKATESSLAQFEEERRLLKTSEPINRRERAALYLKIETDTQCHKDELQRLELKLSRLKVSSQGIELSLHWTNLAMVDTEGMETRGRLSERIFDELDNEEDFCSDRNCFICVKKEVSVVLLPCAHQVLCSNCSEGRAACPCCGVPIEQRIQVFGAESS